jgi:hypothetical protein
MDGAAQSRAYRTKSRCAGFSGFEAAFTTLAAFFITAFFCKTACSARNTCYAYGESPASTSSTNLCSKPFYRIVDAKIDPVVIFCKARPRRADPSFGKTVRSRRVRAPASRFRLGDSDTK